MDDFQQILNDTRTLLEREAGKRRRPLALSPEVAAMLEALDGGRADAAQAQPEPAIAAPSGTPASDDDRVAALAELRQVVSGCTKCRLCEGRTQTVFGDGTPFAELVFVGEAPGE